jgi:high-affinity iron transporter
LAVLPTFVIGLREGLEASLIVGIIATFLGQQGRRDALRWMWAGVVGATALCGAVAIVLRITEENLPQRQQEGLETVVGLAAVAMVTWMIVWMRRHARGLKHDLEGKAAAALAGGSVGTLVAMAFVAVLREGFETAVFLLAAFQGSRDPGAAGTGATLGVLVAIVIGIAIYRGGLRINLEKFFRFTGFVLVLVAAGLVATAAHTAHEAGWLNIGQREVLNLTAFVGPGSIRSALLTGMLGVQVRPVTVEVLTYLAYVIPMVMFVLWPARRRPADRSGGTRVETTRVAQRNPVPTRTAVSVTAMVAIIAAAGCGSSAGSKPRASDSAVKTVTIELVKAGCSPAKITVPAGPTKFEVTNTDAGAITEMEILDHGRIVAEVENVPVGLSGSFSVTLKPGTLTLWCPGGSVDDGKGTLTVTGDAVSQGGPSAAASVQAVARYRGYLVAQSNLLVAKTTVFTNAVVAGNLVDAKAAYAPARVPYERIEPVAESFGSLDPAIDARANDVPAAHWSGFHKIEQALYARGNLAGMAPVATQLLADVKLLDTLVKRVVLEPATIANGAVELLNEVTTSKVTGEEERYSHIDLVDLAANVEGSQTAFDSVATLLPSGSPVTKAQIDARFAAVDQGLQPYRRGDGFVLYTDLVAAQTRAIAQTIDAAAEPLSKVAEQIVA